MSFNSWSGFRAPEIDVVLVEVGNFYEIDFAQVNTGMIYLGTVLKNRGFRVNCVTNQDLFTLTPDAVELLFRQWNPRLVSFYLISDNLFQVRNLAAKIKQWLPACKIILGGPLATIQGEKLLEEESFDFAIKGEGEESLLQLMDYLTNQKGDLANITGLVYKSEGKVCAHSQIAQVEDLDALPFPDYDLVGVKGSFNVVSGRGCPYQCVFCFQGVHGRKYRYRSADQVVKEIIGQLEKYQVKTFGFIDDTFVARPERSLEIAEQLQEYRKAKGTDFVFYCEGRVDILSRYPELLEELAKAGLSRLQLGIESGNQDILDAYHKNITLEQIRQVVRQCAQIGTVSVFGNFILGGPFETEDTFKDSLLLAEELLETAPGLFECSAALLAPYPGTQIAENPEKFGLVILDQEFKTGITLRDVFAHSKNLTTAQVRSQYQDFLLSINEKMKTLATDLTPQTVELQFTWAKNYGMRTNWHELISRCQPVTAEYFNLLAGPRFVKVAQIPDDFLPNCYPMRVLEVREYSPEGKIIILKEGRREMRLEAKPEILAYELACGKLTMEQIALELKKRLGLEFSAQEIIKQIMMPVYIKLEENFHLAFYG